MERPARSEAHWESAVEKQIREAMARGEFDNLPGQGKPLPGLDGNRDDDWWIKQKLKREQISYLPPALALRKEVEDALARITAVPTEAVVRAIVTELNERIVQVNTSITAGPASTVMPLDVEAIVANWRAGRAAP